MNNKDILDPLWITKGVGKGIDAEYSKYVLLAANKKYRELLDEGNTDKFYEILFHSLNLNNLAINGKIYDSKMNAIANDPKLKQVREYLIDMYSLPQDMIDIFRNSNHILVTLLVDYLDEMIYALEESKLYYLNEHIHAQREIFIIRNYNPEFKYEVWKLKFDGRYNYSHNLSKIEDLEIKEGEDYTLMSEVKRSGNMQLKNLNTEKNVVFISHAKDLENTKQIINSVSNSIVFYRAFDRNNKFNPRILEELREVLLRDKVIPFALNSIV